MTINYSYTVTNFDLASGRVAFNVRATDGAFTYTVASMYWLDIDELGRVPTVAQVNDIMESSCPLCIPTELFVGRKALATVGITNPTAVTDLITTPGSVTTTLFQVSGYFTPLTFIAVASTTGIVAGMLFDIPTAGVNYTVVSVSGQNVIFTPSASVTPNFIVGTSLTFRPA